MENKQKQLILMQSDGFSLIEVLIAMAVLVLSVSAIGFLILDSYTANRAGQERTQAVFLAQEGIEASQSIRDNNWDYLTLGVHGLAISGDNWVFQGASDLINNKFTRAITVSGVDHNRKEISSNISWNITAARPSQVELVTYLTDWGATAEVPPEFESCAEYCVSLAYISGTCRQNASKCAQNGETYESGGDQYCTGGQSADTCCCAP